MKMLRLAATLAALMASSPAAADDPPAWQDLWAVAVAQMKDPGSAFFRNAVYVVNRKAGEINNVAFCASVNARNSYGGYGGFAPFIISWMPGHGSFFWDEKMAPTLFGSLCGNEPPSGISPDVTRIEDMTQP